MLWEQDNMLWE